MGSDRQRDMVDKQPVGLLWTAERRQYRAAKTGNRDVVDARAGLIVQVANSRRAGVVGDRVQCFTRQIKKQGVVGLVEQNGGIAFQIIEACLAGSQVAHRGLPAILPILMRGEIAELQTDEERVFPLD
jgi:hypothetical protein